MSMIEPRRKNVIRVLARTSFDFGGVAAGMGLTIPVAQHIDVSRATEVSLAVRLHAANIPSGASGIAPGVPAGFPGSGPYIGVIMDSDLWTREEPALQFVAMGATAPVVGCPFTSQTNAPSSMIVSPTQPFGGFVLISILGVQANDTPGPLSATLSIDLILKGVDEDVADGGYNTYMGYR